jgi:hypothetical protein
MTTLHGGCQLIGYLLDSIPGKRTDGFVRRISKMGLGIKNITGLAASAVLSAVLKCFPNLYGKLR